MKDFTQNVNSALIALLTSAFPIFRMTARRNSNNIVAFPFFNNIAARSVRRKALKEIFQFDRSLLSDRRQAFVVASNRSDSNSLGFRPQSISLRATSSSWL